MTKIKLQIKGMHCQICVDLIKDKVKELNGINKVNVSYSKEIAEIDFDETKTDVNSIMNKIEEDTYSCNIFEGCGKKKRKGWIFGLIGFVIVIYFILNLADNLNLPQISQNMSYGLLFLVGLLTGFHCISMCGGFVVSYTLKNAKTTKPYKLHLMYATGKIISYTIIGAAFGFLGSIIAFTPLMRGVAGLLAGLFLVLFGLKMLNIFPILRKIQFKTPKSLSKLIGKKTEHSSPLFIGLLNGLMIACGPLQAIYIMAAGTGSLIEGAKLLFIFALGTLPVMIGFGYFASMISKKATHKILKASGAIVLILGLIMMNNGLVLTGSGYDIGSLTGMNKKIEGTTVIEEGFQEIRMDVTRYGWEPNSFILKKDVPVKWIIKGKEINGCNNAIQVPKLGLEFNIKKGEQIIEFTPTEEGTIKWSCWMGMIPGTFIVKEDTSNVEAIQQELNNIVAQPASSCGAGGGSCGCGK
ncbi:MAG: sulfite exporter TauE/SafE family protein [Nanoarchaeota archaeon]|nr:sulfite exporter TauE/SafE family protein [Nanoarchaeota archaeon]